MTALTYSSAPPSKDGDSGHWYTRDGSPCYMVPARNGAMRNTTLADARKLLLVPSVTTVTGIIAKPQLTAWMVRQGILAALTLPRIDGEPEPAFLDRVEADSRQQAKDAANEGTNVHDALELRFTGQAYPTQYARHVAGVEAELHRMFPDVHDWIAERSFAHPSGYGGKTDLHSPSTGIVVDFKGKDGDFSDGKKLAYDELTFQLGAYQDGLRLPRAACGNIFFSRTHPGKAVGHVWKPDQVAKGAAVFHAALGLWKALKGFDPAFEVCDAI